MRVALFLAAGLLLAGCVSPLDLQPAAVDASDVVAKVRALLADVPCQTPVGDATSENLLPLSLTTFDGTMHAELDARGDLLLNARYQAGGFEVIDVSDPTAPRVVATYQGEETTALDVKWLPSGDAAIVGNPRAVQLVDMRDPANPVLASQWNFSDEGLRGSAHMVDTHVIGGKEWVFVAPNSDTGVYILEREGWSLTFKASYKHPLLGGGPLGPHDMTVLDDEILQKPVLYVANGFEGWLAADVSDPTKPVHLGGMLNVDPAQGYLHTIQAEKIGERRIVATISEVGVNALKVWDATDLSKPVLLAEWFADPARATLPGHNLQILNGLLYDAYYGKGVYVFDLTKLGSRPYLGTLDLKPIAHFAPPNPEASSPDATAFVNVWDVVVSDGALFVSDVNEGVHALGFGCIEFGDALQSSRG